jgi:SAM-dependent methyltransferase
MDDADQALAYAEADFAEANGLFVRLFRELVREQGVPVQVVDLGCGPADIPLRLAGLYPDACFDLIDGAGAMLELARQRWGGAGLLARARLVQARVPADPLPGHGYDAVISNSLLHHLHDPAGLWTLVGACARPGAPVLVMDLRRPSSPQEVDDLVQRYAADAPALLRRDFRNSLRAAFTPAEVRAQLTAAGLGHLVVDVVSDRHLAVRGRI